MRHLVSSLLLSLSTLISPAFAECIPQNYHDDIVSALRCLTGVTATEVSPSSVAGYRQFEIKFIQPTDHAHPEAETFEQRLVLLHKDWDAPMVLQTSGYSIFGVALTRLAKTFGTNQLQIEHRFFSNSTPSSHDLSKLDIAQSAADFHRITVAFKELYRQRWVGTGASKGGMTSTYHRRFYPQDLDGTVADVAPLSFSTEDQRYVEFLTQAGGELYTACRTKIETLQQTLLLRRDELQSKVTGTFSQLGNAETAYEHAVIELPFAFWQYQSPQDPLFGCERIPSSNASADELFKYLSHVSDVSGYDDDSFVTFGSYYYQAGTQLGAPATKLSHLTLVHPYTLDMYMPHDVDYSYADTAMRDIEEWIQTKASSMIFVYGEFDPWSAAAYPQVEGRDMHRYVAPGANHGAKFTSLATKDRQEALAILQRWFNRAPLETEAEQWGPVLDDLETAVRQKLHLP